MKAAYAIAFDLDTTMMDADGLTRSQKTRIYQTEIPQAFSQCGFKEHPQGSFYHTQDEVDPIAALLNLKSNLKQFAPSFCKYVKRVHILRMEEWSDVTADLSDAGAAAAGVPAAAEELAEQEDLNQTATV